MPSYQPNDRFAKKAKFLGYRARSIFKLEEIDQKFKLFEPGIKVLDLGAAPGSWLQYASEKIGEDGLALGLDLKEIEPINDNVVTKICDILDINAVKKEISSLGWDKVDLIISDLAPNTSGIKYVDQIKSIELNQSVVDIANILLKPNGKLVMKIFQGEGLDRFIKSLKQMFSRVNLTDVKATRESSREIYIICRR